MEELQAFNEGRPFFGKFLRECRIDMELTLITAAKSCGINPFEWSDIEHGRRSATLKELESIAQALHTSMRTLVLAKERLDQEQEVWLQKHPKIVQWLKDISNKER